MCVLTHENQVVMQMTSQFLSFPSTQPLKYLVFTMSATTRSYEKSQWTRVRFPTRRVVCAISPISFPNWVKHQRMSVLILASWHQLFQSLFNGMWWDWNSGIYQRLLELHPAGLQSVQTATNATCFLAFFKNHSRTVFQVPLSAPLGVLSFETMDQRFKNKQTASLHQMRGLFIPRLMTCRTKRKKKTGWAESFAKITFNLVSRSFWRKQECSKLHQNTSNRSVIHGKCGWSSTRLIFARNVRSRKMFRCQESWRLLAQNNLYFFVDTFVC